MAPSEPSSGRDLVCRLIDAIGVRDDQGVVPFVRAWSRLVGVDLGAHTRVLDVSNGTVLVGVDHPAWLQRLHMNQKRVLVRIQRDFPTIGARRMAFSVVDSIQRDATQAEAGTADAVDDGGSSGTEVARGNAARGGPDQGGGGVSRQATPQVARERHAGMACGVGVGRADDDEAFLARLTSLKAALEAKERKRGDMS